MVSVPELVFQVGGVHPQPLGEGGPGPPPLELLRGEKSPPLLAHLEAVLEGRIVQWEEYHLQDVIEIPLEKQIEGR